MSDLDKLNYITRKFSKLHTRKTRKSVKMSDDEVIKFEITDYDLDNEFTIKHRKGLSKHQQIYGIWADNSDKEEEEERPAFQQKKLPKGYTAPIDFVAGGVHQAGKKKDVQTKKEEISDDEHPTTSFKTKGSSSESEDEATHRKGFGTSSRGSMRRKGSKFAPTQSTMTEITAEIAGLRRIGPKMNTSLMREGVGNWEKHTKGIGAKLLLQMGYEPGKGLGKELQGISAPVEAHLRKGRGAIGAYGPEKLASIAKLKDKSIKAEVEDDAREPGESKWKKNDVPPKKTRYYYRSVDDVIEKGKRPGAYRNTTVSSELTKVKVIDMTGPQQRVLSGYHALSGLKAPSGAEHFEDVVHRKCSNFALPELQYNLNSLVDMCEQEIISIDRSCRNNENRLVALEQEKMESQDTLGREEKLLHDLGDVLQVVERLLNPAQEYSLSQVAHIFIDLQDRHYEEYTRYEVGELAPGLVGPLLTSAMASWNPLTQPDHHLDVWRRWKNILEVGAQQQSTQIQPYHSLLWHTWIPVVRTTIKDNWKPRDCDPLIHFIDRWKDLLPQWILDHVFDQLVVPKLLAEVNLWNPLTDTLPIHVWIHPWIPLLDSKLKDHIYPVIQDKLGVALTNWHPSDRSAKFMLKPWQRALPEGSFVAFLLKHVVPKLQLCMQNFVINPHQQPLDGWEAVMDWADMMSVGNLTLILDKYFFPRWLQVLAVWLNHNPDYMQVTEWYQGWKRMLSPELLAQTTIRDHFHKALELMNRSISNQPGAQESLSYLATLEGAGPLPPPKPMKTETIAEAARTAVQIPSGFKELVERRCEERGLLFVPVPHKFHEARQTYKIGGRGLHCYFDRNVVFYSRGGPTWLPTSLDKLLDMAS